MMTSVPRIALATATTGPEPSTAGLAVLAGLTASRWRVQHYPLARVSDDDRGGGRRDRPAGAAPGHLADAAERLPVAVLAGARAASLGWSRAALDATRSPFQYFVVALRRRSGEISAGLTRILDLPIVSVISVIGATRTANCSICPTCRRGPRRSSSTASADDGELERDRRLIRLTHGLPIVGAVDLLPAARSAVEAVASGELRPVEDAVEALGASFLRHADLKAFADLATSRVDPTQSQGPEGRCREVGSRGFRVAYAHDEAFGRYFPDTLEALEALGGRTGRVLADSRRRAARRRRSGDDRLRLPGPARLTSWRPTSA